MTSVSTIEDSCNLYSKPSKLVFIYDDDDDDIENTPPTYWQNEELGGEYLKKIFSTDLSHFLTNDDDL